MRCHGVNDTFKQAVGAGASLCGMPPTGRQVRVPVVSIMNFTNGGWTESWTFADELAMLLQLGAPNLLLE